MPARTVSPKADLLRCLGTGDGWPCADRNHSSYLYQLAGTRVLVDCGESVTRSLTALKFGWDSLDAILISHSHADHLGGLQMLLQGLWLEGRSRPLTIHMPAHAIEPVRRLLQHGYLFDELFGFKLHFAPLHAGKALKIGRLKVTPFATSHLDGFRKAFGGKYRIGFDAYSFLIEGGGKRVVHSADIGSPEDLLPLLHKPVDLLVCELAHFLPGELFASLRGHAIRRAAFIHVARSFRQRLAAVKRQAAQGLPEVKHLFPKDGETVAI